MSLQVLQPQYNNLLTLWEIYKCLRKNWTGMGYKTIEFEKAWIEYSKVKNAHFVNSCTSALHLALSTFKMTDNWQEGDEIITTPLTFVSTNHAILYENLEPRFADVDDTLCLDPDAVKKRITKRTKAIMYVGIGGNSGNYFDIKQLCYDHGLKFIVDGAHMSGTWLKEMNGDGSGYATIHAGSDADASCFSFQAVKNLPTADSGMLCFKEAHYDKLARKLSWMGIDKDTYSRSKGGNYLWKYDVPHIGFKYNGNSIMAAMGLVALKKLEKDNSYRRSLAAVYQKQLKNVPGIQLVEIPWECEKNSRHLFQIRLIKGNKFPFTQLRDKLINKLYSKDIYPGVHYITNTDYSMYEYGKRYTKNATKISNELISLPLHLNMTRREVHKVTEVVKEVMSE